MNHAARQMDPEQKQPVVSSQPTTPPDLSSTDDRQMSPRLRLVRRDVWAAATCTALIAGCRRQAPAAQAEFYRRYRGKVEAAVLRVVRDASAAEDLVQDAFVQIFKAIGAFEGRSQITTWIYRVAANVALRSLRRRRVEARYRESLRDQETGPETPFDLLARKRTLAKVQRALDQLPQEKRDVFLLRQVQQLDHEAIAKIAGVPAATVRTRLYYARRRLQDLLEAATAANHDQLTRVCRVIAEGG